MHFTTAPTTAAVLLPLLTSALPGAPLQKRFTFPLPASSGSVTLDAPQTVGAGESFDGEMQTFGRGIECGGQGEGGESDTVFIVEEGGHLSNVIVGADQNEGIYCMGACTIENVWWEKVCEDALTIHQTSGVSTVIGGGAQGAEDKVFQHNGSGTLHVSNFTVYDFGKLYRSCGNCDEMFERHIELESVTAVQGSSLVGINSNYGDTATIDAGVCVTDVEEICVEYEGNDTGDEPEEIGSGPSDACIYSDPLPAC
ncbi:hypothetical protein FQN54_000036 [Arachnomyces sp. PD_36]|nr:hypothetical protein FQN54_000036 [Arachnomyces sp. PD_36]